MALRLISLRHVGTCRVCASTLAPRTKAYCDPDLLTVVCVTCHELASVSGPSLPPGAGGRDRRTARAEARLDHTWGRFAGIAKAFAEEPRSIASWRKGSDRPLAAFLDRELDGPVVMLHGRKVPHTRGDLDHLVIAPSGVWVIDTKHFAGKAELRDAGRWRAPDPRLFVDGRDRTALVDGLGWQVAAVRGLLDPIGFGEVPIHPVLLFSDSEWGRFAKPFEISGVRVLWGTRLVEWISGPGPMEPAMIDAIAAHLDERLPAIAS